MALVVEPPADHPIIVAGADEASANAVPFKHIGRGVYHEKSNCIV